MKLEQRDDPRRWLLDGSTADDYRSHVAAGAARVAARLAGATGPATGIDVETLAPEIDLIDLDRPLADEQAALDELDRVYLRDAVYFHHPRYLAHLNCPVVLPAVLGETVLSAVNSSLDTWDQSVGGTLIERRVIRWTADRIGLGPLADGVFTSGGTQSNLQAMLVARDDVLWRMRRRGQAVATHEVLPRLRIFASAASHFSVVKAARLLGLGDDAVVTVATDAERRMQPLALERALERCRAEGAIPMAVVATAGTTDFGSIDPITEISRICRDFGLWLHVDAAYGCGLLVSRKRRHMLDGVERADSVTVDYHKSFFQPVSSSALIVSDGQTLRHVTFHADYLNPKRAAEAGVPNQVDKSIQTTRRFDALKMWLTLRVMGPDAVGELFDSVVDLAAETWDALRADPRFEVLVEPELSTLVFRWVPWPGAADSLCDRANLHARAALFASGEAMVAGTRVDGRHYLKFTLLNPKTTPHDIAHVLDLIAAHAADLVDDEERAATRAS